MIFGFEIRRAEFMGASNHQDLEPGTLKVSGLGSGRVGWGSTRAEPLPLKG